MRIILDITMPHLIRTPAELEACIGRVPGPRDAKVIDHVDEGARAWLAASPLLFAALEGGPSGIGVTLGGGRPGFAQTEDPTTLVIPCEALDDPSFATIGRAWGSLFVVPGLGETLRINGTVSRVGPTAIHISVLECYLHCAKALIRSDFWQAAEGPTGNDPMSVIAAARFLALATSDGAGHADLSPKGDPAGGMLRAIPGGLAFADRPGNRRTDSWLNVLVAPRVAVVAVIPGSCRVATIHATVSLSREPGLRNLFLVRDKVPVLVASLEAVDMVAHESPALARAALWPARPAPAHLRPADLFAAHVRASRTRGVGALMAKAMVSVPGLMRKGLDNDYKNNLY